jgi:hypothetical protein
MKKIYLLLIITLAFFGKSLIAHGAITDEYKLLEPIPCIQGGDVSCLSNGQNVQTLDKISFNGYVGYAYRLTIALAVFLTVVMMIVGGFEYMLSESFTKKGAGKDKMKDAALGLLGVLISYTVLETIDPRLVQIGVNIEPITVNNLSSGGNTSENFLNSLDQGLGSLSAQSLRDVANSGEQRRIKLERIKELEDLMSNEQEPAAYKEYEIERDRLKSDIVNIDSGIQKSLFQAVSQESLRNSLIIIDDLENKYSSLTNKFNGEDDVNLLIKKIEDRYSAVQDKLNVSDKQQIQKEKQFYIDQIKEEKDLMSIIFLYKNIVANNSKKKELKDSLNNLSTTYKKQLDSLSKLPSSSLNETNKELLKNRISKIESL